MKTLEFNYHVSRIKGPVVIDGNWNKPVWKDIKAAEISCFMGTKPKYFPAVQAKMMYNDNNLYVIFQVKDRFVRCLTTEYNGPVWEDACVEFFFSPDISKPELYFNLEINCGGVPLMHYNIVPRKESIQLVSEDIKKVEISGSLSGIIDPEIREPVDWTLEYRIPIAMLEKYSRVTRPASGIQWRGNFYKIAENNSNPHYLTWAPVKNKIPDFHLPAFFGYLTFE